MTDVCAPGNVLPPGDRLVYVPLEALPKELLDKLGDFKVIVRDETTGDRVHPKERLGEVLEELNRDYGNSQETLRNNPVSEDSAPSKNRQRNQQPISPDTTDDDVFRFDSSFVFSSSANKRDAGQNNEDCLQPRKNRLGDEELNSSRNFSDYESSRNSPKSRYTMAYDNKHLAVYAEPMCDSRIQARVTMDTDRESQGFQTILECTPQKHACSDIENMETPSRKSPRYDDSVSCDYVRRSPYHRDQPTPGAMCSSYRQARQDDVIRARKQLFASPRCQGGLRLYSYHDDVDHQKENCYRSAPSSRPRDYQHCPHGEESHNSPGCSTRLPHPGTTHRRLKRKQMFEDDLEFVAPYQTVESPRSGGVGDRLLEMLNPSKRACYDYTDIGPSQSREHKVNCACSMMETHFLQMTECAYRNIRRKDSSRESFEQFNRELTQTNSVLKESVNILRAIQQICSHRDQRIR